MISFVIDWEINKNKKRADVQKVVGKLGEEDQDWYGKTVLRETLKEWEKNGEQQYGKLLAENVVRKR